MSPSLRPSPHPHPPSHIYVRALHTNFDVVVAFSAHARIFGESFDDSLPACAFFSSPLFPPPPLSGGHLARANSTLQDGTTPQWLSKLRQLWTSVIWPVTYELVSLIGSHTTPGQNSQPSPTSMSQ